MDANASTKKKKISFRYKYNDITRKRYFLQDTLNLSLLLEEVSNLFIIPQNEYEVYTDEDSKQKVTQNLVDQLISGSESIPTVQLFVKQGREINAGDTIKTVNGLEQHLLDQLLSQELVKKFIKTHSLGTKNMDAIKQLRAEELSDREIELLSNSIIKLINS